MTAETPSKGIDAFWLKIIAIIGMTMDHIGVVMGDYLPFPVKCILFTFGGLTFPIMAYLLCEGYRHTRNFKKYALRLLIFALITQLPYFFILMSQLNVLFTLLLGLLAIHFTEKVDNKMYSALIIASFTALSVFCDWGLMGVPMIVGYYYIQGRWAKLIAPVILPMLMMSYSISALFGGNLEVLPDMLFIFVGCTLTIPLLSKYSGQRGRPMKYFFYGYYPIHIIIIGIVNILFFKGM